MAGEAEVVDRWFDGWFKGRATIQRKAKKTKVNRIFC